MSTKERRQQLVDALRQWQRIEQAGVTQSTEIIERARNPVIRLVMEIIQRDSAMHHRVQQLVIDSLETQAVSLTVDDLEHVWSAIEAHTQAERRTTALVAEVRSALAGTSDVVQLFLLSYLANDERKHDQLLEDLALIKRGMYRSA